MVVSKTDILEFTDWKNSMSNNLRLINETTTTAGANAVNVLNVFSDDFSVYKIVTANLMANNSTASGANLRLIEGENTVITDAYYYAQQAQKAETSFSYNNSTDEEQIFNFFSSIDDSGQAGSSVGYIYNPYQSYYTMIQYESIGRPGGNLRSYKGSGLYAQTTEITGFQIDLNESAGEFAGGGLIRTFGIRID